MALTGTLIFATFSASISSLLFGFNIAVVSNPRVVVSRWIRRVECLRNDGNPDSNNTELWCKPYSEAQSEDMFKENSQLNTLWTLVASMIAVGALCAALASAVIVEKFGRKGTMLLNNIPAIIGAICMFVSYFASSYELLIVGRIIIGFSCGLSSGIAPMYMTEIAPAELRGAMGSVAAMTNVVGLLIAQTLGLPQIFGNSWGWPYLFGFPLVLSVLQLCTLPFCPESPKHLYLNQNDTHRAEIALKYLQKEGDTGKEMARMEDERIAAKDSPKITVLDLFRDRFLRGIIIICIMAMLSQQFAGINVVMFYSTAIFTKAGLEGILATYATLGMGGVFFLTSVVAMFVVEKAGRKILLLVSLAGMAVLTVLLVVFMSQSKGGHTWAQYLSVTSVIVFLIFYAIGAGPIPWFIANELFTQGPRASAMMVVTVVNWLCTLVITLVFPLIEPYLEEYTFLIFTGCLIGFVIYTWFKVPETKGKRIDEIQAELRQRS